MAKTKTGADEGSTAESLVRVAPWIVGLLIVAALGLDSYYTVAPHEQAVVLRFGKVTGTSPPGLHFKVPLVDEVLKASVEERSLRMPFGAGERPEGADESATLMLTGDLNTAAVEWTVQWRVTDARAFLTRLPVDEPEFAEQLVATASRTVMNRLVGDYSFDEVIGSKRGDITDQARRGTQAILDAYECGITIPSLQLQRVTPPGRVKPAFDRVNASIQMKQKLENDAEAERNKLLPAALADKDRMIREAEGYAARRSAEATGEIEALVAKYRAYQQAPELTRRRMYLEAMQEVLSNVRSKTIIDAELRQALPVLPLGEGSMNLQGTSR